MIPAWYKIWRHMIFKRTLTIADVHTPHKETCIMSTPYWADNYVEKSVTAEEALAPVESGQMIFIGSGCGEPRHLVKALAERARTLSGLEVIKLHGQEAAALRAITTDSEELTVRSIYLGATQSAAIAEHQRFVIPMNMSEVPALFTSRKIPLSVALVQVSSVDDFGWMSLGISVDVSLAAALSADYVVVQVNPRMPRVMGQSFIHVNDVHAIVHHEEPLITLAPDTLSSEAALTMGKLIARQIEDGSTLQIGLDAISQATVLALSHKNDLGVHSQFLTDDIMHLYSRGNINNRKKGFHDGKMVASLAIGTENLYEFLNDNPAVAFHPSDYVNNPLHIAKNNQMVSLNVAQSMDFTGQVSVEASPATRYAGVSGIPDFVRGALLSPKGKSILMIPSTRMTENGPVSNIVPRMDGASVVVPRGDVHHVVSEYGSVNLFGKTLQERALAMISLAHPDFREELFEKAKEQGLMGPQRNLGEATKAVYPVQLESTLTLDGKTVILRPTKPVDDRRIQEHFYNLAKEDIISRFFHEKTAFGIEEVETRSKTDYVRDLTLVAVVGEFGFGRVVALGESFRLHHGNMVEVAFSVSREYQNRGLGKVLIGKLAEVAKRNGSAGIMAVTTPKNSAMIKIFNTLPYKVKTRYEDGDVVLSCRFDAL